MQAEVCEPDMILYACLSNPRGISVVMGVPDHKFRLLDLSVH